MNKNKKIQPNDWRRQGQEKYLKGVELAFKNYIPSNIGWNHDHCEFCGAKFSQNEGDLNKGYTTENSNRWICNECFNDFKDEFCWNVKD